MPTRLTIHRPLGSIAPGAAAKARDQNRGTANARGYTAAWNRASRDFRMAHPLCATCERHGRVTAATLVDHIVPHRGDQALFWDRSNWQSLCVSCHGEKAKEEARTRAPGASA